MNTLKGKWRFALWSILLFSVRAQAVCDGAGIESWITTPDRSQLLARRAECIAFADQPDHYSHVPIIVDERQAFQPVDGFGFALTGGSAEHLQNMSAPARRKVLRELFGNGTGEIGISYLRLTLGASDLNSFVYSYNDLPEGQVDPELKRFSLGHDHDHVIPVLKEILAIAPRLKIMASPWSAPTWMKDNSKWRGGSLRPEYYAAYAQYFAKYVLEMRKLGVTIDAITVQNEPLNFKNTPSMSPGLDSNKIGIGGHHGEQSRSEGRADSLCTRPIPGPLGAPPPAPRRRRHLRLGRIKSPSLSCNLSL